MKTLGYSLLVMAVVFTAGCRKDFQETRGTDSFPLLSGPYLGQKTPGLKPEIFAPGIISTGFDELGSVFSPDMNEFVFSIQMPGHVRHTMLHSKYENGRWAKPEVLSFSGSFSDADPAFSPDGKYIFFTSFRTSEDMLSRKLSSYADILNYYQSPGNGNGDVYWIDAGIVEKYKN